MLAYTLINKYPNTLFYGTERPGPMVSSRVYGYSIEVDENTNGNAIRTDLSYTVTPFNKNSYVANHYNKNIIKSFVISDTTYDYTTNKSKDTLQFQMASSNKGLIGPARTYSYLKNEDNLKPIVEEFNSDTLVFTMGNKNLNETKSLVYEHYIGKNKVDNLEMRSAVLDSKNVLEIYTPGTPYDENVSEVSFTMGYETGWHGLQEVHNPPIFHSSLSIPITASLEVISKSSSFRSYIKDAGLGGSGTGIGNLEMELEVFRLCEYRFKFPKNYLNGLMQNNIAYAEGDVLIVHSWEIGQVTLYTDHGTIKINTVPGMRINKRRMAGAI